MFKLKNIDFFFFKKSFLIFVCMFFLFFGCKTSKTMNSYQFEIGFGSGGGFTGKYIEYIFNSKGELYKINSGTKKKELIKTIDFSKTKSIFEKVINDNLIDYIFSNTGNMNKYIEINSSKKVNKIIWSNPSKLPKESIISLFDDLNFLVK
jgi:hypothetical protein